MTKNEIVKMSFGGVESPRDYRDVPLTALAGRGTPPPESYFVDIRDLGVWHQRKIGACVGHAAGKNKQQADWRENGGKEAPNLSARFLYALAKCVDDLPGEGTYYRLGVKMMQKYGCATEGTVPNHTTLNHEDYVFDRNMDNIPAEAFNEAEKYKIKSYARVGSYRDISEEELKIAIYEAKGALLGMDIGNEWWTSPEGKTSWREVDILPLRPLRSKVSGHAVYLYGYDVINGRTRFHFLNSWSADWGKDGSGYFFYDEIAPQLVEAWTFVDLPNDWKEELKNLPGEHDFEHCFNHKIGYGQRSEEVRQLQIALKIDGTFPREVKATGYYGPITARSVLAFTKKYSVAPAWELAIVAGRWIGPKTRSKLNELFCKHN